jgi:hypothetical protein
LDNTGHPLVNLSGIPHPLNIIGLIVTYGKNGSVFFLSENDIPDGQIPHEILEPKSSLFNLSCISKKVHQEKWI